MSDLTPFAEGRGLDSANTETSDLEVFKPVLDGFDWPAYEARQDRLDEVLGQSVAPAVGKLILELHETNPEVGVEVNNLHNTVIEGSPVNGLHAKLAVISASKVGIDLRRLDFNGGVGSEADFSGRDISGSDFVNTVMPGAKFIGTNLRGVDFTNSVLNGVDFTDAETDGVDLTGAYVINPIGLTEEQISKLRLQATRAIVLDSSTDASLEQLLASRFGKAQTVDDLKKLLDPVPVAVNYEFGAPIGRLQTKRILRGLYAQKANWSQVDFTASDLTGAVVEDLKADQGSFRAATIGGMIIRSGSMREFDFTSAWAPGAVLEDVDLRGSSMAKANLVGSVLRGVDLRGVTGLSEEGTNINGLVIGEGCLLPQGYGYDGVKLQVSSKLKKELNI